VARSRPAPRQGRHTGAVRATEETRGDPGLEQGAISENEGNEVGEALDGENREGEGRQTAAEQVRYPRPLLAKALLKARPSHAQQIVDFRQGGVGVIVVIHETMVTQTATADLVKDLARHLESRLPTLHR
jgi:hypothetical protein